MQRLPPTRGASTVGRSAADRGRPDGSRGEPTDRGHSPCAPSTREAQRGARERRLLVVEDEPEVRRVVEQLLRRFGYAVELAGDGPSAIEVFQRDPKRFDAVLLDLGMPGMDGWECLERFDRLRAVPVLVSSGCDPSGGEIPARRGDAALAFLAKPYSGRALRDALERLIAPA